MAKRQADPERERFGRRTFSSWQSSGQAIREYRQQQQVTETAFHHWRRERRQRDAKPTSRPSSPGFVPVTVIPSATSAIAVHGPSGHAVMLSACAASVLRGLFAALAPEAPC